MKYLIILFLYIFINFINCEICSDKVTVDKKSSCGSTTAKLIVYQDYYAFESINIDPMVYPIIDSSGTYGSITYNLKDGISYTLTYVKKGCSNTFIETFQPYGLYYELESPKCLYSLGNIKLYNYNGIGNIFNYPKTSGYYQFTDSTDCSVYASVIPIQANNIPNVKVIRPTCGISNSASVQVFTNSFGVVYSSIELYTDYYSGSAKLIQPTSSTMGEYLNIQGGQLHTLVLNSTMCGTEVYDIQLSNTYQQILVDLKSVPNFNDNSTISFSFSDSRFNSSSVGIYYLDKDTIVPQNEWNNYKNLFINGYTNLGHFYNKDFVGGVPSSASNSDCITNEYISTQRIRPDVGYTVTRSSSNSSCLVNVTITLESHYENDVLSIITPSSGYEIINNSITAPFNVEFQIFSKKNSNSISFNTNYVNIDYELVEINTNAPFDCWKLYNLTILNHKEFKSLRIRGGTRSGDYSLYPDENGLFSNIAANFFKLYYIAGDCEEEQLFPIDKRSNTNPFDNVSIEFEIVKNATCDNDATVSYRITTPFGVGNASSFTTRGYYNNYVNIPYSWCYYEIEYNLPSPILSSKELTPVIVNQPSCSYGQALISIENPNSNYQIQNAYLNGNLLVNNGNIGEYNIPSGDNNITIEWNNGGKVCFNSKTITTTPTTVFNTPYNVVPVAQCNNPDGSIEILNIQDYTEYNLKFNGINVAPSDNNPALFSNLVSGIYDFTFKNLNCEGGILESTFQIFVPTLYENVDISTITIKEPSCSAGDGFVRVQVKINDQIINNSLLIQDIDKKNSFYNGVYKVATPGLNQVSIKYGGCIWYKNFTSTLVEPEFSLERFYNSSICSVSNIYKVKSPQNDLVIQSISNVNAASFYYYQGDFYIYNTNQDKVTFSVGWNQVCSKSISANVYKKPNLETQPVTYQLIRPDQCDEFSIDIIITNYDSFQSVILNNKQPELTSNKSVAIFRKQILNTSYQLAYVYLNGCSGTSYISGFEFNGIYNVTLSTSISDEICFGENGKISLNEYDLENYYYILTNQINWQQEINYLIDHNGQVKNLAAGSYSLSRYSKSFANCRVGTNLLTVSNVSPSIKSIKTLDSYDTLNNGSFELCLNYDGDSSNIQYQISSTGSNSYSTINSFTNLSPNTYQIKVTIKDVKCPIVLESSFTINKITSPPSSSSDIDTPSNSNILVQNLNLLLLILSLIYLL